MGWIKSGERTFSAEEFDLRARRAATVVAGFGLTRGDGVALYLRNDIAYFEAVFGAGMLGSTGIAAGMFGALGRAGVNILVISTSEISISCLIPEKDVEKAVNAIHDHFFPQGE